MNTPFRKRLAISNNVTISFDQLPTILDRASQTLPFENLAIIEHRMLDITKENLANNILVQHNGGLCYELNPILYLFLIENGFHATLVRGDVYDQERETFQNLGRTHVTILIEHQQQTYLIDTGFGGNLPLTPIPLTGETVQSKNGAFRITPMHTSSGNYIFEMKLKHKHTDWHIGYAFDSRKPVAHLSELNEVQTIIAKHEASPFNKRPLLTAFTPQGRILLTNTHFIQWTDGVMTKKKINEDAFPQLAKQYFGVKL
ncbi:arylamine N-acetyltransferase [Pontibacillus litoralis JSM 072002]|uniref:Arylamine N-acetyltransferase n=1 Tax=Pontibacillus litoralis JSM 072002 TaxID=1385512 RepID=A0A0A5G5H2_9BACI|nr:arylamine N-acetyltransferase [Pontibacillus litoralis JSM 072002]